MVQKHLRDHVHSIQRCKQVQVITLTGAGSETEKKKHVHNRINNGVPANSGITTAEWYIRTNACHFRLPIFLALGPGLITPLTCKQ